MPQVQEIPDNLHREPMEAGQPVRSSSSGAKWTGFYRLVEPKPNVTKVTDNQAIGDQGTYGNFSWYQRLVQGSASRLTRYREYDLMDNDVEVARALDTIAEEMTGNEPKTDECLIVQVDTEKEDEISNNTVLTLKAALKYWNQIHDWETRLFKVSRMTAKYGDCFFRKIKHEPRIKWQYIHPKNVVGALVDENDVTNVLGWQIKTDTKRVKSSYGVPVTNASSDVETELVPSEDIVRFTLNDDMSDAAPFGDSVLGPVYRAHKQKELLEDAIIIYRIQRAPERRVFYIDVGKMPPQRVKTYLEQIKNEIKQKKVPNVHGGQQNVDSVYNPQSMSEDFFFAQRADGRGSKVDTLPGGQGLGELADLEYFQKKVWRGLRIPTSYMTEGAEGAVFNDGKVGVAYIQELRFSLYIQRLQGYIEKVLDEEFKKYLRRSNIIIDESIYRIRLPEPTNFGTYRQQETDAALLGTYGTADAVPYLSKRFIMSRYLQLGDEEIIMNERMLREERGMDPDNAKPGDVATLYGMGAEGAMGGMGVGGMTAMGGPGAVGAPGEELGVEGTAETGTAETGGAGAAESGAA